MSGILTIQICSYLQREVEAILEHEQWHHVSFRFLPSHCGHPSLKPDEIYIPLIREEHTVVIGGCCLQSVAKELESSKVDFHSLPNCFYLIGDKPLIDQQIHRHSYLLTPGWLGNWRSNIEEIWKFNQETAREFFADTAKQLVLLDTGIDSESESTLEEMSSYLGLPAETIHIGLDHLTLSLKEIIGKWQEEVLRTELQAALKNSSDRSVALDLLGKLTQYFTEKEVINQILELFAMLFAADEIFYLPLYDLSPGELIYCSPNDIHEGEIIQSIMELPNTFGKYDRSFHVTIQSDKTHVGIIQVNGVSFPQYIDHYLNLALEITSVCGLAIVNVRNFQKLEKAKNEQILITKILKLFIDTHEQHDEMLEILRLIKEFAGVEAVAIRLKDGMDFPYQRTIGFNDLFVKKESHLCSMDPNGKVEFDKNNNPVLMCLCGRVIKNEGNATLSYFTDYGSFWTSNSERTSRELNPAYTHHFRGECISHGYRSIALIPLRGDNETFGLLQLNDHHYGMFSEESIRFLEKVGNSISIALQRKKSVDDLAIAKNAAEDASRAKSAFLANMSHELRTPLNAIIGYSDIISRDMDKSAPHYTGLHTIKTSGEHLLTLINDVLDISKIEAGKLELFPSTFYLGSFLQDILAIIRPKAEAKEIELIFDRPTQDLPFIVADEKRLRQVLLNLLSNAVKFTKLGSVTLKVALLATKRKVSGENQMVISFSVKDTGIGINKDDCKRIFEPFEQSGTYVKQSEGTGLGLTISHQIIEKMGGTLTVESEPNVETVFSFTITVPVQSSEFTVSNLSFESIIGYEGPKLKILVVDDKEYNQRLLWDLLTPLGFTVILADNGKDGLAVAEEEQPQLIIMDLIMPINSGFVAIQNIKDSPEPLCSIPIIAVSASVFEIETEENLQTGADIFLSKPIHFEDLLDNIATLLRITWIHRSSHHIEESIQNLIVPPEETLDNIYASADFYDYHKLKKELTQLRNMKEDYSVFIKQVEKLADLYQLEEVCYYINELKERGRGEK